MLPYIGLWKLQTGYNDDYGLSAEIIDARSLVPFNYESRLSPSKDGRILLVSDACERGSYLNDLAQNISELAFDYLDAPLWSWGKD